MAGEEVQELGKKTNLCKLSLRLMCFFYSNVDNPAVVVGPSEGPHSLFKFVIDVGVIEVCWSSTLLAHLRY